MRTYPAGSLNIEARPNGDYVYDMYFAGTRQLTGFEGDRLKSRYKGDPRCVQALWVPQPDPAIKRLVIYLRPDVAAEEAERLIQGVMQDFFESWPCPVHMRLLPP